ncbi:arylamine N-acetyltransferase [Plantactinospora siamensis]|uniref:Arylamine N-acetyltransferase n=1 Tax=Plantactinospora siamensis TaxID=555372 RepID=A0ABV6NV65_9ACTN
MVTVGRATVGADCEWRVPPLPGAFVEAYLARLGLDPAAERAAAPSPERLRRLHAAHVAGAIYETLWIALGEPLGIDPVESARRVARGRGGYCYHLNGAFSALLTSLGYDVRWHRGGVQGRAAPVPPGDDGNHLALTARLDGRTWWLDVGLGDGPLDPVPLADARFGPGFRLRRSDVVPDGWRLDHEPAGSFAGMDFSLGPTEPAALLPRHVELSTSPDSGFVRVVTAQHRTAAGTRALRGCVLSERSPAGAASVRDIDGYADWRALLTDGFGLVLDDVPEERLAALWRRVRADHERWDRAGRP